MKAKALLKSLFGGLVGLTLTGLLFYMVNASLMSGGRKEKKKVVSQFEVAKVKKKKRMQMRRPQKKKKPSRQLKPDMSQLISGMSFGIPAFELDMLDSSDFLKNGNYMDGAKVDEKPQVSYRPDLDYPEEALSQNISGYVVVGVFIDQKGKLQKVDLLESQPKEVFDEVALDNIKKWRFKPAYHKGVPVATWQEQKIVFNAEGV